MKLSPERKRILKWCEEMSIYMERYNAEKMRIFHEEERRKQELDRIQKFIVMNQKEDNHE